MIALAGVEACESTVSSRPPSDSAKRSLRAAGDSIRCDVRLRAVLHSSPVLSTRQQLAVAQLLLRPPVDTLFLDNAFSRLSRAEVEELCQLLRRTFPRTNVVHISTHITVMAPVHDVRLTAAFSASNNSKFVEVL